MAVPAILFSPRWVPAFPESSVMRFPSCRGGRHPVEVDGRPGWRGDGLKTLAVPRRKAFLRLRDRGNAHGAE